MPTSRIAKNQVIAVIFMKSTVFLPICLLLVTLVGCDFEDTDPLTDDTVNDPSGPSGEPQNPVAQPAPSNPTAPANTIFAPTATDIGDVDTFYDQDGYATPNVIRMDVRTVTTPGICTIDDQSGCTLADVIADTDGFDDFKVEIPIHVSADDFPNDGSISNATLRQRGNSARFGPQKSFRIKLDSKDNLWRNERRLQLNKHPFELSRIKNKLSFDLIRTIPHFPSLRTQFINLWIDDGQGPVDFGLFTHVEFAGEQYLRNRGINENDNLYKVEFFQFFIDEINALVVDDEGQPQDIDAFESLLEIESGNNHTRLVEMVAAVNDMNRSFDSVLDQYFNRNNVLTWITANLLMHQTDAITHNFYIYNPEGSERFYFLPWDYDGTFELEPELTDSIENSELSKRKFYGYARGINSVFVSRFYQLPGIHQEILAAANELRANSLTDAAIFNKAQELSNLVEPFLTSPPDSEHANFSPRTPERFVSVVSQLHTDMRDNYDVPMPPTLATPTVDAQGLLQLRWQPAFDVTGRNTITYDLILASSPFFEDTSIVYSDVNIPDAADEVAYSINTGTLPSGRLYARLIARPSTAPTRFWQTNSNVFRQADGSELFGMLAFDLP